MPTASDIAHVRIAHPSDSARPLCVRYYRADVANADEPQSLMAQHDLAPGESILIPIHAGALVTVRSAS